jgi:uncharacterized lipoprotein YbaY
VQLVKGKISFAEKPPSFAGATIHVRLEDITDVDVAAKTVAEYVQRDVAFDPESGDDLLFAINGDPPDPRASYSVRVHIDLDGDGEVSSGDFISMQSYPVITFGHPRELSIIVRPVK